jgi:hypothetical protein
MPLSSSSVFLDRHARLTFDQHLHGAVGQFQQLQHTGERADFVQILDRGSSISGLFLRDQAESAVRLPSPAQARAWICRARRTAESPCADTRRRRAAAVPAARPAGSGGGGNCGTFCHRRKSLAKKIWTAPTLRRGHLHVKWRQCRRALKCWPSNEKKRPRRRRRGRIADVVTLIRRRRRFRYAIRAAAASFRDR